MIFEKQGLNNKCCFSIINPVTNPYIRRRASYTIYYLIALFVAVFMMTTGCYKLNSLSKKERKRFNCIHIARDISMPDTMRFVDPKTAKAMDIGILFGIVGVAVADAVSSSEAKNNSTSIRKAMIEEQIDISKIFLDTFEQEIQAVNIHPFIIHEGDDCAEFRFQIVNYGLHPDFKHKLKPQIVVALKVFDPNGSVIWKRGESVSLLNKETPSHTTEELIQDPALIREAFHCACMVAVDKFIEGITKE